MADQSQDTPAAWIPEPGTTLDGRYRLDRMVDRGGMGVIMSAEHLAMRREVAVKLLSPAVAAEEGYRARFRREVGLAAQLEHPNIVRCYDFGETDEGVLYLVMEMLSGRSLATELQRDGRISLERSVDLMAQLADGLTEAHTQDMVHRDLKPGNVYIVNDSRGRETVKLLDFGLARLVSSDDARITKTGKICGTASYLPPEMLLTQENTMAGDVYACGLIMLELVLGRKVFSSWSTTQTFLQQLILPARIPRRIYETPYGQLIARCLMKHPDDRPQNADVLYQELTKMVGLPALTLQETELPPALNRDLADALLDDFTIGRIQTIDALRLLPVPEPFDPNGPQFDETATQRIVMSDIHSFLSQHDDEDRPTVRLTASEAAELRASRGFSPPPVSASPEPASPEPAPADPAPAEPAPTSSIDADVLAEERGRPMALYAVIALVAVALSALFMSFTSEPQPDRLPAAQIESAPEAPAVVGPVVADDAGVVAREEAREVIGDRPDVGSSSSAQPAAAPEAAPKPKKKRRPQRAKADKPAKSAESVSEPKPEQPEPTRTEPATEALLDKYLKVGKPK